MKFPTSLSKVSAILFLIGIILYSSLTCSAGPVRYVLKDQGIDRVYYLHIPEQATDGMPLVFVLHGYGGSADNYHRSMVQVSEKYGFALCYPEGSLDERGKRCWNVGYPWQESMQVDDVRFLKRLARRIRKEYHVSRKNVFCTGMSNGGEMCYLLAYKGTDVFSAVAPVSGLLMDWMYKELKARKSVSLLEIHGTEDGVSQWGGDPDNSYGWGAYLPVPLAVSSWAYMNRCDTLCEELLPTISSNDDKKVIVHRFTGGLDGAEVVLYEVVRGQHSWHMDFMDTDEEIWSFFRRHLR